MRYTHFSKIERLEISILRKKGYSQREIASVLGKNHSSVSREIARNSVCGDYAASKAHHKAYVKRKYSKYQGMKVRENPELETYVREKMTLHWSPEQIAGRLRRSNGGYAIISHRVIYKYLYSIYGYRLCRYMKYRHCRVKKRKGIKTQRVLIPHRVGIEKRPNIINDRKRFGDYEGDTMGRPRYVSSQTLTVLRERTSRKLFAKKISRLAYAMEGFASLLKPALVLSITFDNGVENVRHQELGIPTFFCHPYSSWEKGSVEQGIGVIREYIPKKADLKDYSSQQISAIIHRINNTPMKCLDFKTPNEVFNEQLSLIP